MPRPISFSSPRHERGVALIIVLAALVLMTVLVLAFLTSIGSELQSSKMYANGSSVKLLAQSSVALVTGEIQAATADQTLCWASEPGMIRTYKNDGTAGAYYKLYSDDGMTASGAFDHTKITNLVPDGTGGTTAWYKQKGVYVDLNQPIYFNGSNYYPILDGNSADYLKTYADPLSTKTLPVATGTISALSPTGTNGLPAVTGYWLNSNTPVDSTSPNVAPMPVKWLYVLKNGEVIVPDSNPTNGVVTFTKTTNQPQPSQADPIVGRIAFWTDDETCKVNINTASEGTFWDTPRSYSKTDYNYATSQPVQNEFQRYPGHPATVSLSAVFNGFTGDSAYPENFYPITPRVQAGGSTEGTVAGNAVAGALTMRASRLYPTADDFLFQPTLAGTPGIGTRTLNDTLLSSATELNAAAVQKAGFFITACSEAPDVNVFNLPRVSMWPITLTGATPTPALTAYDQLIAFCGTVNGNKYYFQRWDPTSATNDLPDGGMSKYPGNPLARNRDILEYLRTLTSHNIPGFGGSFSGKYGSPGDDDQILTEMFDYIRSTNLQDSSSGATTYTQSFDKTGTGPYQSGGIGQVVPIQDTTVSVTDSVGSATNNPRGFGRFPTVQQAVLVFIGAGDNATDPSPDQISPVLNNPNPPSSYTPQVAVGKQRVQAGFFLQMFDPSEGVSITRPWYQIKVSHLDNLQWNGISIFPTSASFPFVYNTNGVITKPIAADVNGNTFITPAGTANGFQGFSYGGLLDFRQLCQMRDSINGGNATAKGYWGLPVYPFISPPTGQSGSGPDLPAGGTFNFSSSGDVVVQIYSLDSSGNPSTNPIQTINLNFPTASFPVPYSIDNNLVCAAPYNVAPYTNAAYHNVPPTPVTPTPPTNAASYVPPVSHPGPPITYTSGSSANYDFLSFLDSFNSTHTLGSAIGRLGFAASVPWLTTCDVVRAIVATPGDMRLVAARQNVPDAFYQPITGSGFPATADYYGGTGASFSHMLRITTTLPFYGAIGGKLISATGTYDDYASQYFLTGSGYDLGDSTYNFGGGSGVRPKDNQVPNQSASVLLGNTGITPGDWDNGFQNSVDGAFVNKADEGDAGRTSSGTFVTNGYPYYELDYGNQLPGPTFFTPNRMIPSPGMFGSLSSGVWHNKAWQTLLFRPGPANHPGLGTPATGPGYSTPPDHLYLDLFNMPVVEPYAISTPLATAGRINMNYLIIPFTYINRDTGLRAAMKSQMVTAISSNAIGSYKSHGNPASGYGGSLNNTRYAINLDSTLSQFLARFYNTSGTQGADGAPDIFRSASEICDIDLVPSDATAATLTDLAMPITRSNMDKYWVANALTGDNSRERPYTNLYPLLTTKSNTFTVHFRVQTLKQALTSTSSSTAWQSWREGTDVVTSEYRGSQTIERYVDPNAASVNGVAFPDYASPSTINSTTFPPATPLSSFYKFRVVSSKQFPP